MIVEAYPAFGTLAMQAGFALLKTRFSLPRHSISNHLSINPVSPAGLSASTLAGLFAAQGRPVVPPLWPEPGRRARNSLPNPDPNPKPN